MAKPYVTLPPSEGTNLLRAWFEKTMGPQVWSEDSDFVGVGAAAQKFGVTSTAVRGWLLGAVPIVNHRITLQEQLDIPLTSWPRMRGFTRDDVIKDITGQVLGIIYVIGRVARRPGDSGVYYSCVCDAGHYFTTSSAILRDKKRKGPPRCIRCYQYSCGKFDELPDVAQKEFDRVLRRPKSRCGSPRYAWFWQVTPGSQDGGAG